MTDTATARAPQAEQRRTKSGGGPPGRLTVGDYVGGSAADAVQAVRRTGLRPGLDRSFGCEPSLTGLVVAQDPEAGSELVRNGMVTLYVAVPDAGEATPDADEPTGDLGDRHQTSHAPPESVQPEPCKPLPETSRPPRRKPARSETSQSRMFDPPPQPTLHAHRTSAWGESPAAWPAPAVSQQTEWEPGAPAAEPFESPPPTFGGEPAPEDHIAHTEELFNRRIGVTHGWPGAHPHRAAPGALRDAGRWAARHRIVTIAVSAMIAAWIVAALLTTLASAPARGRTASSAPQSTPARRKAVVARRVPAPSAPAASARPGRRSSRPRRAAPSPQQRRRAPSAAPVAASAVNRSTNSSPPTQTAPASTTPAAQPTPQPADGGPFSP